MRLNQIADKSKIRTLKLSRIFAILPIWAFVSGCATTTATSGKCLAYVMSGDITQEWTPTVFYRRNSDNQLFLQIPVTAKYIPTLQIMDQEFGMLYPIKHEYNPKTHQIQVEDNQNEYVLSRTSIDDLVTDSIDIMCARTVSKDWVTKNKLNTTIPDIVYITK